MEATISGLRNIHLNKEMKVKGYVLKAGDVRPRVESIKFQCKNCAASIIMPQKGEILAFPYICNCGINAGFNELEKNFSDIQQITLTDPENNSRKLSAFLKNELCDQAIMGKKYMFEGKLRESPVHSGKKVSVYSDFALEVSNIVALPRESESELINVTSTRRKRILLFEQALINIQKNTGKLIPKEMVEKELQGKFSKFEIDECVSMLGKEGKIFEPRKGFLQIL